MSSMLTLFIPSLINTPIAAKTISFSFSSTVQN
jgi:hypothetical protein